MFVSNKVINSPPSSILPFTLPNFSKAFIFSETFTILGRGNEDDGEDNDRLDLDDDDPFDQED